MGADTDALHELAAAIADGSGVDWPRIEGGTTGSEHLVEQLRLIAKIAEMHRSQDETREPGDGPGGPPRAKGEKRPGIAAGDPERWGGLILIEEVGEGSFGTV